MHCANNILKNIGKLNAMSGHNLHFKLEEKDYGLFLTEQDPTGWSKEAVNMKKEKWLVRIDNNYYENVHITEGTRKEATDFVKNAVKKMVIQRQKDVEEDGTVYKGDSPEDVRMSHNVSNGVDFIVAECFIGYEGEFDEQEAYVKARAVKLDTVPVTTFDEIMKRLD